MSKINQNNNNIFIVIKISNGIYLVKVVYWCESLDVYWKITKTTVKVVALTVCCWNSSDGLNLLWAMLCCTPLTRYQIVGVNISLLCIASLEHRL